MEKKNLMGAYETPDLNVIELAIEGVLCGSPTGGDLNVDPWEEGNSPW